MKRIVILGILSVIGLGTTFAQAKRDSVRVIIRSKNADTTHRKKVIVEVDVDSKAESGENKKKSVSIPGKVVGVQNRGKTWFVGIEPSLDFGWSRFNTNQVSTADQATVSDLSLEKGPHFGLNIFKAHFNLTKKGVLKFNSGLGLDYNSYHFRKPLTLTPAQSTLTYTIDENLNITKNILRSTYITMPFMLSGGNSKFNVMAGYELSVLISGKTKQIIDGNKIKERDNFNLNPFRQGLVFRLNYNQIGFYAKYYITDVFANNQGPQNLQNFNIGISLGGF